MPLQDGFDRTIAALVDLDRYPLPRPAQPPVVLLAGSFAWKPNVEGALRFLDEGWPRARCRPRRLTAGKASRSWRGAPTASARATR